MLRQCRTWRKNDAGEVCACVRVRPEALRLRDQDSVYRFRALNGVRLAPKPLFGSSPVGRFRCSPCVSRHADPRPACGPSLHDIEPSESASRRWELFGVH